VETKYAFLSRRQKWLTFSLLMFVMLFLIIGIIADSTGKASSQTVAGSGDMQSYLPLFKLDPTATPTSTPTPVPTATPIPPVPQFVKNVELPNAQCPNAVGFNAVSGYVYIANNFSSNVSAFKNTNFIKNIATGEWPTLIAADNDSPLTYVTVLHGDVTAIDGTTVVGSVPNYYEPYGVAVNPVNGYAYITDLDSAVQVANGTSLITNIPITDPDGSPPNNGAGWLQAVVVDPDTGLVYVTSWSHGKMYVLDGTGVIADYRAGWGIKDMALDADRDYIYLAHSDPNATYPHNISVFHIPTQTFTYIDTDPGVINKSRDVAVDPISGYAYVSNHNEDTVTVLLGPQVITTLPAGDTPWHVAVNPNTGYVFVTNLKSNDITVIKGLSVVTTIPAQGLQPFAIGVDTITNDVYIANRGDEYDLFQCRDASVTILR
jgi:YVTN family beta-propeller protein